ncbi:MAG: hypothetical protein E7639_06350 [Ruminococcaceae bacterium]|nr:hypothetical protein [Oscillospiraceae bacterium]
MKKKKIVISACAVLLVLAAVGGILGVRAYKKHIAPIEVVFFDRPDSVIIHYVTGSAQPVSKELSEQEITLFYHDMQALLLRGGWVSDIQTFSPGVVTGTASWDKAAYESRKHRGSIELRYERPRRFHLYTDSSYQLAVCDTVIIELRNDLSLINRPGLEVATGYKGVYLQGIYHSIQFQREYYNLFFDTFTSMF